VLTVFLFLFSHWATAGTFGTQEGLMPSHAGVQVQNIHQIEQKQQLEDGYEKH